MNCLFCDIIEGKIPSYTIYEDEIVKVFLDINPKTNGECLITTKKHLINVNDLDESLSTHILKVEKKLYKMLKEKLGIKGLTIIQNNDCGQEIKHYHIHLIPRYQEDDLIIPSNSKELKEITQIFEYFK